jgi:hypothetical protein
MRLAILLLAIASLSLPFSAQAADPPKPSKVCSVTAESGWRDSIREGDGATVEACESFMRTSKATQFQVGCMAIDGMISLGAPGGAPPSPNCGW